MYIPKRKKNTVPAEDYVPRGETPSSRMFYVLTDHFWQILRANLLCVLFCLPVITIPASLAALHAVIQQYYRKGYGDVWPVFIKAFREDFVERLFAAALPAAAVAIVGLLLLNVSTSAVTYLVMATVIAVALILYGWLFPQLPFLDTSPLNTLKNALILMGVENMKSFALLAVQAVFLTLTVFFLPVSLLAFLFLIPLAPVMLTELIAFPVLEDRLVKRN